MYMRGFGGIAIFNAVRCLIPTAATGLTRSTKNAKLLLQRTRC
jgi:hypothetical protein